MSSFFFVCYSLFMHQGIGNVQCRGVVGCTAVQFYVTVDSRVAGVIGVGVSIFADQQRH